MRKFYLFMVLSAITLTALSGNWVPVNQNLPAPAKVNLVSSSIDQSTLQFTLGGFYLTEVQTPQGPAMTVQVENATPMQESGAPDLPKISASVVIPDQAGMTLHVVASSFRDYPNILIAPSKGVISRNVDPATVPYTYGPAYSSDRFFPAVQGETRDPYIVRDLRGQTIIAYPFQYNPVTKTLRVYYNLTIELRKTNETGINPLVNTTATKRISQDYLSVFNHQFINFDAVSYTPLAEYGNLLVICYSQFMNAIRPYVDWKRAEGYHTELVNKDSVGTTAAQIKAYIANYYNTKGLTHVLLVGDAQQIPTNTGGGLGGPSDNAYGYVVGTDHYADLFVGRFSAENETQVQTQVQRTLEYEQNPQNLTDDWFTTVIGIASDQGPGDDGEYDYQHIRNQQTQLLGYKYTMNPELFDGSQGGNDANGNPTPPMVATEVNNGASLILYTGHGSKTSWGSSGFSNTNVNQLTNVGKLPFIWSVACVNGDFTSGGACFAEAWLRASQGGQPTGAIAFLGSTINQSWNSPMEGQDAMTNILIESDSNNIKRTFAGLSINGCMKMIDAYGTDGANMADTWTIFGDPTIMVRTSNPQNMTAQYDNMIFITDSIFQVTCDAEGARVTLTLADSILATGIVANSEVSLTFPPLTTSGDTIHMVITGYNQVPVFDDMVIHAIPAPVVAGFSALPTTVVPGHTVAFADTSAGTITHRQWHFEGGTPEFSSEQNPVVQYDAVGVYSVKLTVGDGFTTDSILMADYITADFPATVPTISGGLNTSLSPNPCKGSFILKINSSGEQTIRVVILDVIGNIVQTEQVSVAGGVVNHTVNMNNQPDGIYFVKISGNEKTTTQKLIIRR